MNARIPLTALGEGEIEQIRVNVASTEAFRRVGLERSSFILGLSFEVVEGDAPGTGSIRVTSRRAAREPFISFLLEITSGSSRVLREYTLLLDPEGMQVAARQAEPVITPAPVVATPAPVMATPAPAKPAAQALPTVAAKPAEPAETMQPGVDVAQEQQVSVPEPQVQYANEPLPRAVDQLPESKPVEPEAPKAVQPAFAGAAVYGPVSQDETLWRIGTTVRPDAGITMDQVMWALYDNNRDQFDGDINHVRAGAMLTVPSREEMLATGPAEATRLVRGGATQTVAEAKPKVVPVPKPKPGPTQVAQAPPATPVPVTPAPATPAPATPAPVAKTEPQATAAPAATAAPIAEDEDVFAALDELAEDESAAPEVVEEEQAALESDLTPEEIAAAPDAFAQADAADSEAAPADVDDAFAEMGEVEGDETTAAADAAEAGAEEGLEDPFAELDQLTESAEDQGVAEAEPAADDTPKPETADKAEQQGLAPPPPPAPKAESFLERTVAVGPLELPMLWLLGGGGALIVLLGGAAVMQRRGKGGEPKPAPAKKAKKEKTPPAVDEPEPAEEPAEEKEPADEMAAAGIVEEEPEVAPEPGVGIDLAEEGGDTEATMQFDRPLEPEPPAAEEPEASDETQILDRPIEAAAPPPPPEPVQPEHVGTETVSLELSEDPLSEADFHIAYGLYDEAAVLLTQAIESDPDRLELREKLAETYFASGNAAEFETTARALKDLGLDAAAWQKVVILGQQICPESDLFAGEAAAAGGVDMDLGGGAGGGADLDFSLDEDLDDKAGAEPVVPEAAAEDDGEISLDDSLEFDLDELDVSDDDSPADSDGDNSMDFDVGDLELPEAPAEEKPARADDNSMDFDVGDLDVPEAPAEEKPARDDSNLMEFDVSDLDTPQTPAAEEPRVDSGNLVEFDLGTDDSTDDDGDLSLNNSSLDDLSPQDESADLEDGGDLGEFDLADEDDADESPLSDGDEMATKLDLARAYVDMGEGDMARSLLDDVLAGGDDAQKADAQALIDKLG